MSADRNLLFGVLALQMDFICRDALVQAMHAWVLAKAKPLGQILVEQGAMREDARALLEPLVHKHLELHGNDAEKSLASVGSVGPVRHDLEQIADKDVNASLTHVSTLPSPEVDPFATRPSPETPPVPALRPTPNMPPAPAIRYRALRPHAKGGLGQVFIAEDTELGREVALKEIQSRHADDQYSRSRFILEAEVNGKLEHPSIVPVYGLGQYADGRPYYAMRFIRGETFQDAIHRFHEAERPNRDPGERELTLRQLLGQFVAVCNAVAYAHARGIAHRDIKPANVMVGQFGETLLVDWGLAKVVGRAESSKGSSDATLQLSSESAWATQQGSAIGTPAFMPPEQAAGRLDQFGPRSDIYSLGATLYCLLTGRAPFEGRDVGELLLRVQQGDILPPRRINPRVPAALEAVCLKAMALQAEDRYATSQALAGEVERWLADEPVTAYREPLRVRAGRWARRHKATVGGLVAAAIMTVVFGGAGAWWLDELADQRRAERERQETKLRHEVETALDQVGRHQEVARWAEANAVLAQAENRLVEEGPEDLRLRAAQMRRDISLVQRLDDIRLAKATIVQGKMDFDFADEQYAAVFGEVGPGQVGDDPQVVAERVRASTVRRPLIAALDDWSAAAAETARRDWLLEVARIADPDSWRDRFRSPFVWNDAAALSRLAAEEAAADQSPQLVAALARQLRRVNGNALGVLRRAQTRHPDDFWLNFYLGVELSVSGHAGAAEYHRAALALRPNTPSVYLNLGTALQAQGRLAEAAETYRRAIGLEPKYAYPYYNLGNVLYDQGKRAEAAEEYRKAIALVPKDARAHNNLGFVLYDEGKRAEAEAEYRKAIALDPKDATPHFNLGLVLRDQGRLVEAAGEYRKAIALDPKYATPHYSLGNLLYGEGKLAEAAEEYRKAIALDPKYASPHNGLGNVLKAQGKQAEAAEEYRKAITIDPKFAHPHNGLGIVLQAQGKQAEAAEEYRKAIAIDAKFAPPHTGLGNVLKAQGKQAEAAEEYRNAITLDPNFAEAHNELGICLYSQGRRADAAAAFRRAIVLDPKDAVAHYNLGKVLDEQDRRADAEAEFRQAISLNPKLAAPHNNLGQLLQARGRLSEAEKQYRKTIALDPKSAIAYLNLGLILDSQGRAMEAAEEYRKAISLDSKLAAPHFYLGNLLIRNGQAAAAADAYRNAIALDRKDARPLANLGRLLVAQGRLQEAVAVFRQATALGDKTVNAEARRCEQLLALTSRLPAVLRGDDRPANAEESLQFALLCQLANRQYKNAARFYSKAFAGEPKLAEDMESQHRYNAACAAALAGCGNGEDAAKLDESEKVRLRAQALEWLEADLAHWAKHGQSQKEQERTVLRQKMRHWQQDPDLAGVRGDIIGKLPKQERGGWQKLWADVDALLKKAGGASK